MTDNPPTTEPEELARIVHENGPVVIDFYGEDLAWRPLDYGTWTVLSALPSREALLKAERERCAKVAEEWTRKAQGWSTSAEATGNAIAARIRSLPPVTDELSQ